MESTRTLIDRRLIGTWKSDRRRTFREFVPERTSSPQDLRKFKSMFGKLVVRWGRRRCYTEIDGVKDSFEFEWIASDGGSVVVRVPDRIFGDEEKRLVQIHFEGDYYWIQPWWARMREYFRRVAVDSPPKK